MAQHTATATTERSCPGFRGQTLAPARFASRGGAGDDHSGDARANSLTGSGGAEVLEGGGGDDSIDAALQDAVASTARRQRDVRHRQRSGHGRSERHVAHRLRADPRRSRRRSRTRARPRRRASGPHGFRDADLPHDGPASRQRRQVTEHAPARRPQGPGGKLEREVRPRQRRSRHSSAGQAHARQALG